MDKISIKQALIDLIYIDVHLPKVAIDHPELEPIINYLSKEHFLDDEDKPWPSIKMVAEQTGIRYDLTRKNILKLYDLVFPYVGRPYLDFCKVKYELSFSYFKWSHYMVINRFPVPLKVGENITMPFLKAKMRTDRFYINSIRHNFERDIQLIEVELLGGDYNLYWHNRRDEALEKREISWSEYFEKDDYSLREKIIRGKI